jgi:hypothetical protein
MADNIIDQVYYKAQDLRKPGQLFLGFIVDCRDKTSGNRWRIRIPSIHGYCDAEGKNCESDQVTKDEALPFASAIPREGSTSGVVANANQNYHAGDWVLVRFKNPETLTNPEIVSRTTSVNPIFGKKEKFSPMAQYVVGPLLKEVGDNKGVLHSDNGCFSIATEGSKKSVNGITTQDADKCGQAAKIKDGFAANIADFLKIIQDTDGKIGSKFIDKYTGELFEVLGYITKYTSQITALFRSAIGWIKAIITKYARKAIDKLVALIMRPIKGVTKIVDETIEKILEQIGCSFGNLESLISNLIESLLNSLLDSALNAAFSCLDTLVDGILNEILGEVLTLVDSIISSISAIAGLIGGFGDLFGEAINAILDFLGISCGGAGDCTVSGQKSFIAKVNTPGEYGVPSSIIRTLNTGLSGIDNLTNEIESSTAAAEAAGESAAKGIELGTSPIPNITTDNAALTSAFATAEQLLGDSVSSVFDFCNNVSNGETSTGADTSPDGQSGGTGTGTNTPSTPPGSGLPTTAVIVGSPVTKYDSKYMITTVGSYVQTGGTQEFEITRDNDATAGIINFVVYLENTDTARVAGITTGINAGGDLTKDIKLSAADFATDTDNPTRVMPIEGNIVVSKEVIFASGEKRKTVSIKTNVNTPPTTTTTEVNYTVGVYRNSKDLDEQRYPGKNLPNTSSVLNTVKGIIKFNVSNCIPSGTVPSLPPTITVTSLEYKSQDKSATAGNPVVFTITRTPVDTAFSRIKVKTIDGTAKSGTNFSGGEALIEFRPFQASANFSVPTITISGAPTSSLDFNILLVDDTIPSGLTTNLGGVSTPQGLRVGSGVTYKGTINYGVNNSVVPLCIPEIVFTAEPPRCIIQPDVVPLSIGLIAKTTVPGYTLSYQWQRTYSPTSGWTNVTNGSRSQSVRVQETTYSQLDSVTISGVNVPISGWTTSIVSRTGTVTYAGATTATLTLDPISYLLNDEEYYRCVVTASPAVISSGTPTLSKTTESTYVGVTSSGVYLTSVNCGPTAFSGGTVIVYSGTAPSVGSGVPVGAVPCFTPSLPIPPTTSGTPVVVTPPTTVSGVTLPTNPDGPRIVPVPVPTPPPFPTIEPVVDDDGGVVSIPVPSGLPPFRFPPLIPIVGAGVGATARAQLDDDGFISSVVIKSKGIGYTPTGLGNLCGILSEIQITNVGAFYEFSPTVYIDDDPDIAVAAIDQNGRIAEIRITNPKDKVYTTIPRIEIIGGSGFGAAALAVLKYVDCATVSDQYLNIVNKYNTRTIGTARIVDCP